MTASCLTPPRRILVTQLQHHGDVLLTTPIFAALKRHYPGVEIDAMVFAESAPVIAANPDLSHVLTLPRSKDGGKGLRRLSRTWALARQIRERRYDWVLHLNDRWQGAFAALISGAPLRVGYEIGKRNNIAWHTAFPLRVPDTYCGHRVERNLAFLRDFGVPIDTQDGKCNMAIGACDQALMEQKMAAAGISGDYILLHPTSRWFFKCWEDERFAKVIRTLAEQGQRIVLTGAPVPREMALVDSLLARAAHPNVVSLAGQLSLPALAAAIAKAKLFIGVDSLPMHMAAALDVPSVALFGPTQVDVWRPWSDKAVVIHAADYGPLIAPNEVNVDTDERYLSNIPVQPVLDAIQMQLARYSPQQTPELAVAMA